jgi:hypothetical protein
MSMRRLTVFALVGLLWGPATSVLLAAGGCDPLWIKHVSKALGNATPEVRQEAIRWTEAFQGEADEVVARGMLKAVQTKPLETFLVKFRSLSVDDIPFPGATVEERIRAAYRSIGDATGTDFGGLPGLNGKIGNLVSDSRPNQLGALLDLKAADEIGLAGKRPLPAGTGFEQTKVKTDANGNVIATRQYDIVDPVLDPTNPFGGICHESKNWPSGWTSQDALDAFMDEFRRDIVIHADSNFDFYRLNLREATRANLDQLKAMLLDQFDSSFVKQHLGEGVITRVRQQFSDRWDTGPGGDILRLY